MHFLFSDIWCSALGASISKIVSPIQINDGPVYLSDHWKTVFKLFYFSTSKKTLPCCSTATLAFGKTVPFLSSRIAKQTPDPAQNTPPFSYANTFKHYSSFFSAYFAIYNTLFKFPAALVHPNFDFFTRSLSATCAKRFRHWRSSIFLLESIHLREQWLFLQFIVQINV